MKKRWLRLAVTFLLVQVGNAESKEYLFQGERLKELKAEQQVIEQTFSDELRADRTDDGVTKANAKYNGALIAWHGRALAAVRERPQLSEAFDLMAGMLSVSSLDLPELLSLIRKHHVSRPDLGKLFVSLVQSHNRAGPGFVEEMVEKSPIGAVRAQAAYAVGWQVRGKLAEDEMKRLDARAQKFLSIAARYEDAPMAYGHGNVGPNARAELWGLKNFANLRIGKVAPDIAGEGIDGQKLKLSDYRGKITVIVFWASWCGPCMKMVPHEKALVERFKDRKFALIGVNGDDERDKAMEAANRAGITWPSFWDAAESSDGPITKAWNVSVWPTIYVLDAKGVIRFKDVRDEKLDAAVDELLKEEMQLD